MEVVNTVGRRKAAVARVYVKPGKGTITVNHKPMETYFPLDIFQYVVKQPLLVLEKNGFLTRDSREVERKKPGQPGARRKFQFSKR